MSTVEYWRLDESLDLLAPIIGSHAVGRAKQIKRYRDWIVHRNPRKPSPDKIDPATAKVLLADLSGLLEAQPKPTHDNQSPTP
jgi:hypothetical protein